MFEPINNEYFVNDEMFTTLDDAKIYIDNGSQLSQKLSQKTINAYRNGAM